MKVKDDKITTFVQNKETGLDKKTFRTILDIPYTGICSFILKRSFELKGFSTQEHLKVVK